jgi:hypothetical protein
LLLLLYHVWFIWSKREKKPWQRMKNKVLKKFWVRFDLNLVTNLKGLCTLQPNVFTLLYFLLYFSNVFFKCQILVLVLTVKKYSKNPLDFFIVNLQWIYSNVKTTFKDSAHWRWLSSHYCIFGVFFSCNFFSFEF